MLWQTPLLKFHSTGDKVWYTKQHLRKNTLSSFMKKLSGRTQLSQTYTNHSMRVTGITCLARSMYSSKQIMALSGHKSVQSLAIYQHVDKNEKLQMGDTLAKSMQPPNQLAIPGTSGNSLERPCENPCQPGPKKIGTAWLWSFDKCVQEHW